MTVEEQRQKIVEAALAWQRTPFKDQQCVKGAGADCSSYPVAVYQEVGLIPAEYEIPKHAFLWFTSKISPELYLEEAIALGLKEISEEQAQPGDFVMYKFGHKFAHGAIVVAWPEVIHCSRAAKQVVRADSSNEGEIIRRPRRFFTFFPEAA